MEGVACLFTCVSVLAVICISVAMAQTGFVSLDCGASGSNYLDSNNIQWSPDSEFNGLSEVSNASSVTPPNSNAPTQFYTIRYFPGDQNKYCYEFNNKDHGIQQKSAYLVRASFWAGDSVPFRTQASQQIKFKLLINSDEWDDVSVPLPQSTAVVKEMYVVADEPTIAVCLAGTGVGMDTPFISSLVLRPLGADMNAVLLMKQNQADSRAMFSVDRVNYGASSDYTVSYPLDRFDRVWRADTATPSISTTKNVNTDFPEHPPLEVMQTAYENNESLGINLYVQQATADHTYYYSLYFSEISDSVTAAGQRVFTLDVLNGTASLFNESTVDLYLQEGMSSYGHYSKFGSVLVAQGGHLNFSFHKLPTSTYGPLICALELFLISDNVMSLGTDDTDVAALNQVTTTFVSLNSWSGDPCLPYTYNWLNCTTDARPRIYTLSLSNKNLEGEIPMVINNLTALVGVSLAQNKLTGSIPDLSALINLKILDLHNNNLNGPIPEFLAQLPSLNTLLLQNNNLSGDIPSALLQKVSSSSLNFSIAGNPLLCKNSNQPYCSQNETSSSKNHTPLVIGLSIVGAVFALVIALVSVGALLFCILQEKPTDSTNELGVEQDNHGSIIPRADIAVRANPAQCFNYQEIKTMTKNFTKKLGHGGFGAVYHGVFPNGVNVAVKVLSEESRQGVDEFLNEVALLSRTHHKNLVGLFGYCTQQKLMLVYEFMSNGSLYQTLHGKATKTLAWRDRLKIAISSAEGLEYLHTGCVPPIVHRDVKSSNILLNEKMEAKICDFGISKSKYSTTGGDSSTFTLVQGSYGYLDPEYAATHIATYKIDVYAFGIVLLELISGRPALIQQPPLSGEQSHIAEWVMPLVERGNICEIVDPILGNEYNLASMWKAIDVAVMCVLHDGNERPTMSEVSSDLKFALSMELKNEGISSPIHPSLVDNMDVRAR